MKLNPSHKIALSAQRLVKIKFQRYKNNPQFSKATNSPRLNMSNTLIFYSNTIRQDAPTHVIELKREYEMLVMFQLSRPLIKKIKSGCFASPKKALSSNTIFIDKN